MSLRTIEIACHLDAEPDRVWQTVLRPATMVHVARPWVEIVPIDLPQWPETWASGLYRARLTGPLGVPLGFQIIGVEFPPTDGPARCLRDRGEGQLARTWDHLITVEPEGRGTRYSDRLTLDAGGLTGVAVPMVRAFFRHRQRRLAGLLSG
jgi:hypothetical protein